MTLSTGEMANAPDAPNPDHHLPLQTPYCILCRYQVQQGEKIAAVMGPWDSPSYLAYTFGFSFPPVTQTQQHATVYEPSTSYQLLLCRKSDCRSCQTLQDASIYHIDCFHVIRRNAAPNKPSLHDIWTIASWTESLPRARYQASPDITAGVAADKTLIEDRGSVLTLVCGIPQELRDAIVRLCPGSPAWRLVSALNRWRIFQPLLDSDIKTQEFSFDDVKSWCRNNGMMAGIGGSGKIRIQLDSLGISRMDYVNDSSDLPAVASRSQNVWYVVEEVDTMRASRIETKGRFMRIHKPRSFHLWDTPNPPNPALIRWNRETEVDLRVRCISLEDITGLTVFCQYGAVRWIYPHRDENFFDPYPYPHDNSQIIPSVPESSSMTAIFFPFAKGERISTVWVRRCEPTDERTRTSDALAVITTKGRLQLFGKYLSPARPEVYFKQLSGNGMATHLLFQDLDLPFPRDSHFAAVSASVNDTDISPTVPSQLTQSRGFRWSASFSYLSIVSLKKCPTYMAFPAAGS
ncbi:hypothetical protein V8C42DRAFT_283585 [Trichoderma barbatum]